MMIISNNEILLKYIPNVIASATGEMSLFDKIKEFISNSELWAIDNLTGDIFDSIEPNSRLYNRISYLIANKAMSEAIPYLDLVLSPNGFGVVNNNTIAPASKERVERLISAMKTNYNAEITPILNELRKSENWKATDQSKWFASSLVQSPSICKFTNSFKDGSWNSYILLRKLAIDWEEKLASEYISIELMKSLRNALLCNSNNEYTQLALRILRVVINCIEILSYDFNAPLMDIIDYIKKNPLFKEWHSSEMVNIFSPPVFINDKKNGGYFF